MGGEVKDKRFVEEMLRIYLEANEEGRLAIYKIVLSVLDRVMR
jgi:hypothetical protein